VAGTQLPADGRKEPVPEAPYDLGEAGSRWWRWAWALPQAAAWDDGALYGLARRAELEDRLAALEDVGSLDFAGEISEILGMSDVDAGDVEMFKALRRVESVMRKLKSMSGGAVSVMREMRELDNKFGLNAKAMADLRWSIAAEDEAAAPTAAKVRRLHAVDPTAAAG
jgi:hypothetical protein